MSSVVKDLYKVIGLNCPDWMPDNIMYETVMGSIAYGVSSDMSDYDVYGIFMPKKIHLFPHLQPNFIKGFTDKFGIKDDKNYIDKPWQLHHVKDPNINRSYDFAIYNIVQYFMLCTENNPNMVDSLFTPLRCVLHSTPVGEHVRSNRKIFLSKLCWHRYKGYAYSQLSKMRTKHEYAKKLNEMDKHYNIDFEKLDEKLILSKYYQRILSVIHANRNITDIKSLIKSLNKYLNSTEGLITTNTKAEYIISETNINIINSLSETFREILKDLSNDIIPIKNDELDKISTILSELKSEFPELVKITDEKMLYTYLSLVKGYYDELTDRSVRTRKYGFDTKFAYHIVRLIDESQQILETGDLDLQDEGRREIMKTIRNGEWTFERICEYFEMKEKQLESVYTNSTLQYSPNIAKINKVLCECLEMHYGKLDHEIVKAVDVTMLIDEMKSILAKYEK